MTVPAVEAAGGVVVDGDRVAAVHRPKYDDWSLPKGHLEAGESHEDAALREVAEEAGLSCRIVGPAGESCYLVRRERRKRVRYFVMARESGEFTVNDEVDELRWLRADELDLLSYPADADMARAALATSADQREL